MPRLRRLLLPWRRASFSFKFAAVILVSGVLIAVVPLLLSLANTRAQAQDRAVDKVGIALNLVDSQRSALAAFSTDVAKQIARSRLGGGTTPLRQTFSADAGVNDPGDVLGAVLRDGAVVAVHGGALLDGETPLLESLVTAVRQGNDTPTDSSGSPWLLATAQLDPSAPTVFVARQVTPAFIGAIDRNLATSADPADLTLVAGGTNTEGSDQVAVASAPLGGGYLLVVSTPVDAVTAPWQPVVLLLGLILVAMCVIVMVVQTSVQHPLRRLDRAVAALARGQFAVPVAVSSHDELSRLAATFEAMRRQLHATIRATDARAAIATELSATQPLETALARVCAELRRTMEVDAALIVVCGSEMSEPFAIVDGVREEDLEPLLRDDGPLGSGFRHAQPGALQLCAAPASREARLGVREFCVAPLRLGAHVHGVLAVANRAEGFLHSDTTLVASTAEQLALALERYRILAVVQRQATIDDLTGLYNHRFFVDYLGQQVALAERLGAPLAVLMLDIDHFKALNDTHGHQAGDAALAAFAHTMTGCVRRSDLAARYGGEEFAIVMANTTVDEARIVADKIRHALVDLRVDIGGQQPIAISVSIGGAAFPEDTGSASELLSLADEALYRAKRMGRDRTCMASDTGRRSRQRGPAVSVMHTAAPGTELEEHAAAVHSRPAK